MRKAVDIVRKSSAVEIAERRAAREARRAFVATRELKWAAAFDVGASPTRLALRRAVTAQNAAIAALARADAARAALALAWRGKHAV